MAQSNDTPPPETFICQISPENPMADSAAKYSSPNEANSNFTANAYNVCELNMTPDLLNRSFNITLKLLSPAASSGPFCRICHEGDNHEDLVSLCKCTACPEICITVLKCITGSVGLVHITCIEKWLNTRRVGHDKCEICNYTFETIRYPKSIGEWYRSDHGAMNNRHNVLGDIACFSLITPLAAISSFLCFEGAKRHIKWNNSLEAGCLMALATFLITVYIIWNVLTIRYHIKNYFKWRSVNQTVRLLRYRRMSTDGGMATMNIVSSPASIEANQNSVPV